MQLNPFFDPWITDASAEGPHRLQLLEGFLLEAAGAPRVAPVHLVIELVARHSHLLGIHNHNI